MPAFLRLSEHSPSLHTPNLARRSVGSAQTRSIEPRDTSASTGVGVGIAFIVIVLCIAAYAIFRGYRWHKSDRDPTGDSDAAALLSTTPSHTLTSHSSNASTARLRGADSEDQVVDIHEHTREGHVLSVVVIPGAIANTTTPRRAPSGQPTPEPRVGENTDHGLRPAGTMQAIRPQILDPSSLDPVVELQSAQQRNALLAARIAELEQQARVAELERHMQSQSASVPNFREEPPPGYTLDD
ncbi:hypothetical protein B0H19DRAFT_1155962 [Mycena capillaripes]|nr:hypothetical protein B0H19DRAFT_1155962 [Mycena capillaripes]